MLFPLESVNCKATTRMTCAQDEFARGPISVAVTLFISYDWRGNPRRHEDNGVNELKTLRKTLLALAPAAAALGALAVPTTATAATVVSPCDPDLVSPSAEDCAGYYGGNVLGGSRSQIAAQIEGIAALGADYTFDGNWSAVEGTKILTLAGGNMLDFGMMLYGETIIGAHFGNVAGPAGNVTVFYLFDFGTEGASSVTLNDVQGFSNAVLYSTGAVPEPGIWMMLILAFGIIGYGMRARKEDSAEAAVA